MNRLFSNGLVILGGLLLAFEPERLPETHPNGAKDLFAPTGHLSGVGNGVVADALFERLRQ